MKKMKNLKLGASLLALASVLALPLGAFAQTPIKAPSNKYPISDDVKLGQQAAAEVERQMQLIRDPELDAYIDQVGRRLVESIPAQFRHPEFQYSFTLVNAREINAFALPGGFTYVNRGLIEAAKNEGELAGVMAHEISHVALRHGTAQQTKAQKAQWGALGGAVLGSIIGGGLGGVVAQGSQVGAGAFFLKYSREYERQADLLGAQMMAAAGYDPRDLANMFQTIERESKGGSGPEWLSSHPNPGNRYEAINREAELLRVRSGNQDNRAFNSMKARLTGQGSRIAQGGQQYPQGGRTPGPAARVELPSTRYRTYTGGNVFRLAVPENWRELGGNNSITFAPEGAYGQGQGGDFTHGVLVGTDPAQSRNLAQATETFIRGLGQGNPSLRQHSNPQRTSIAGREAIAALFSNVSNATGREEGVLIYTTLLRNGDLFYLIGVAPREEFGEYQRAFENIVRSVQLND